MATYNGRNARVTVGATNALVTELNTWSMDRSADEIDTTTFEDGWKKSDVGMKGFSASLSGYLDPEDATGQNILEAAYESGALVSDLRFYVKHTTTPGEKNIYYAPDTASNPKAGMRVTAFNTGQTHNGVATLSMSLSGSGPVKKFTEVVA